MQFNAQNHIAANVHQLQAGAISDIQNGLATQASLDTKPTLAEMESVNSNIAKQEQILSILSSAASTDSTVNQLAGNDFDAMNDSLDAISTKVDGIKAKTDTLVNTDLTGVEADLEKINLNVKDASLFIPATRDL